ncbi:DUF63 family protein [Halorarum salinum]|uniref:DUF63 family protein n=1 Tax=Halorarum salinum TaxID=2743089 RepID=A0A7D5LBQ3_9EURY|nr:DUF63 family protein [Halobaculum salinum]QLG62731.1 DUF63 family protein [Halobaculum salinum]
MSGLADRVGVSPIRAYLGAVGAGVLALVLGSTLFPRTVYDGFVWQYFWGPVQADANDASCAVRAGGETTYLHNAAECQSAAGITAYPGYTLVSEAGYVVVLLVALSGLVLMLREFDLGGDVEFFYALVPFFLFGGALRVLEDADNALGDTLFPYPWDTLLISPIIYFTVFLLTLAALAAAVLLVREGVVSDQYRVILWTGVGLNVLTIGPLLALGLGGVGPVTFHPQVLLAVSLVTVVATALTWYLTMAVVPWIHHGTGAAGVVVIGAHALDGAANVVGLDYMTALGAGPNLVPKHPVNQFIVDTAGAAWPFLPVKLVAAVAVLAIFDEKLFEDSPRYAVLLLVAVTAVGMGPGTRDVLRATFGV